MQKIRLPFITLCAFLMLCSCNQNEPTRGDETQKNQPANPSTWSPVGHKYVSTDESNYGRYLGAQIVFFSKDSLFSDFMYEDSCEYLIKYPLVYIKGNTTPWYKFVDTLTITKAYDESDESSMYELVY